MFAFVNNYIFYFHTPEAKQQIHIIT